ncbi:MAG TPA: hypothetical protein DEP91_11380 [Sphingomonas bacterium]|uniref:Cupin type-2 domain-containing protein n=1 Tax=Sphingomonas bacterium TaxID=1895847 RepID=A0A3D0WDP9_9SPHN|nr:hypothetical protein [Sphingomonas bacterium]
MTDLPGAPRAYVLKAGEGRCTLVAGQMIHTLAGTHETAGGFGAVVCQAPLDRGPIPLHYHEREHDTWFCTRGRLQVWCGDQSRILHPGDFAYVRPGDVHSYQSVAPRTQFFGVVAPGGWEEFFVDAGEVWGMTALPPADHPYDFSRMGPAMGKFGIMRVEGEYVAATEMGTGDRALPGVHASYFLDAGYGRRSVLSGHLSTAVLTADESHAMVDMRVIEGGRGTTMPTIRHRDTHVFAYVLGGAVEWTIDGETHLLTEGDAVNVPAGTPYATRIVSGTARWLLCSANGNGAALWDEGGTPTDRFSHPVEPAGTPLMVPSGIDAAID